MVNHFAIVLAENKQVFQPGDTISGSVLLNTDKEINLRRIYIELRGMGGVAMVSLSTFYRRTWTYLDLKSILLGKGKSGMRLKYSIMDIYYY